ncbi:DegT/DnrJ/EryC1/StrS family aminotransferase [Novosphingobium sp. ST904]|uniref:DegT/DnrJ/EryC1/StrS family aminotransferase n=1 Tax=Novosphingobium sp. ST904 TaxID=1684385 RepID=UPI000B086B8D|nr:DegT/DnrJ/EryC1/StrS family aminotransferase [Novosphingobium sp. ST904]TCM38482.1 dTDP-4-amino-4,6-dideoxygalactose transaminase [Novosphingobium sp. ST904]
MNLASTPALAPIEEPSGGRAGSAGAAIRPRPVHSRWPRHEPDEIEAVAQVLRSGRVNALVHGTENRAFAAEFGRFVGMPEGMCIANGTLTLEVALRALGIGPRDEVIVPARSFFATASCVLAVGAIPVFADVDPVSQNIDPRSAARLVNSATKAMICVHLAGWPCDMDALAELCDTHGLHLIEDCAQAHGATWRGRPVGSFGAAASFSFCTDKIMSTGGEGGLLLFRDHPTWLRAWAIKDHGKNYLKTVDGGGTPGAFRYVHDTPGSNYRMTEMQAALGRCQLAKLPRWLEARRRNAQVLLDLLAQVPGILLPAVPSEAGHAWYKFYVQLTDPDDIVEGRRRLVLAGLLARGIPAGSGSCPDMSREHALSGIPIRRDGGLGNAIGLGRRTLMFPVDHTLDTADMERIAEGLRETMMETKAQ